MQAYCIGERLYQNEKDNWTESHSASFKQESMLKLFYNTLSSIVIPDFATKSECQLLYHALTNLGFEYYISVHPPIGRIGVTQFEAKEKGKEWYFETAAKEKEKQEAIFQISFDPIKRLADKIKRIFPTHQVEIAREDQSHVYYTGLIRQINQTALIHADFAPYDGKNWKIANVIAQLAWNLCLNEPDSGGECIVYNKPWSLDTCEAHRLPNSYGYFSQVVQGCDSIKISPTLGGAYFFNSRNFHEVKESTGNRITISCFIGLTVDQKIIIWS